MPTRVLMEYDPYALGFEGTGCRGRRTECLLGLGRIISGKPFYDATLQGGRAVPFFDELGSDPRADELVRIRIVRHDVPVFGNRRGVELSLRQYAQCRRQLDGAVFVRVLESNVEQDRAVTAVKPLFQFFSGDSGHRHLSIVVGG